MENQEDTKLHHLMILSNLSRMLSPVVFLEDVVHVS